MDKFKDHSTFDEADVGQSLMYVRKAFAQLSQCSAPAAAECRAQLDVIKQKLEEIFNTTL
jgi:hypothetical protein